MESFVIQISLRRPAVRTTTAPATTRIPPIQRRIEVVAPVSGSVWGCAGGTVGPDNPGDDGIVGFVTELGAVVVGSRTGIDELLDEGCSGVVDEIVVVDIEDDSDVVGATVVTDVEVDDSAVVEVGDDVVLSSMLV